MSAIHNGISERVYARDYTVAVHVTEVEDDSGAGGDTCIELLIDNGDETGIAALHPEAVTQLRRTLQRHERKTKAARTV